MYIVEFEFLAGESYERISREYKSFRELMRVVTGFLNFGVWVCKSPVVSVSVILKNE